MICFWCFNFSFVTLFSSALFFVVYLHFCLALLVPISIALNSSSVSLVSVVTHSVRVVYLVLPILDSCLTSHLSLGIVVLLFLTLTHIPHLLIYCPFGYPVLHFSVSCVISPSIISLYTLHFCSYSDCLLTLTLIFIKILSYHLLQVIIMYPWFSFITLPFSLRLLYLFFVVVWSFQFLSSCFSVALVVFVVCFPPFYINY